jgi:hypothetical protein
MRLEYFASVSVSISPVTVAEYVSTGYHCYLITDEGYEQ